MIDNGMRSTVAFSFSEDRGKQLENLVYMALRRRGDHLYLFKDLRECDFLVEEKGRITAAIQVCYDITPENKTRELEGLKQAMSKLGCAKGRLLTYNQDTAGLHHTLAWPKDIPVQPVWRWLLFG